MYGNRYNDNWKSSYVPARRALELPTNSRNIRDTHRKQLEEEGEEASCKLFAHVFSSSILCSVFFRTAG